MNEKCSKTELDKIKKRFENADIIQLNDEVDLNSLIQNQEKCVIYIGKDKNIKALKNGYKINIETTKVKQNDVDLIFTPQEYADFLIETINLYL